MNRVCIRHPPPSPQHQQQPGSHALWSEDDNQSHFILSSRCNWTELNHLMIPGVWLNWSRSRRCAEGDEDDDDRINVWGILITRWDEYNKNISSTFSRELRSAMVWLAGRRRLRQSDAMDWFFVGKRKKSKDQVLLCFFTNWVVHQPKFALSPQLNWWIGFRYLPDHKNP